MAEKLTCDKEDINKLKKYFLRCSFFNIFVGSIVKISYSNFNVRTNKTCFCETRSISYSKWNI